MQRCNGGDIARSYDLQERAVARVVLAISNRKPSVLAGGQAETGWGRDQPAGKFCCETTLRPHSRRLHPGPMGPLRRAMARGPRSLGATPGIRVVAAQRWRSRARVQDCSSAERRANRDATAHSYPARGPSVGREGRLRSRGPAAGRSCCRFDAGLPCGEELARTPRARPVETAGQ